MDLDGHHLGLFLPGSLHKSIGNNNLPALILEGIEKPMQLVLQ